MNPPGTALLPSGASCEALGYLLSKDGAKLIFSNEFKRLAKFRGRWLSPAPPTPSQTSDKELRYQPQLYVL